MSRKLAGLHFIHTQEANRRTGSRDYKFSTPAPMDMFLPARLYLLKGTQFSNPTALPTMTKSMEFLFKQQQQRILGITPILYQFRSDQDIRNHAKTQKWDVQYEEQLSYHKE